MWTTDFQPFNNKETVGDLTATNGTFVFTASVNLDADSTLQDFAKKAKKAFAESKETADYSASINKLNNILNK